MQFSIGTGTIDHAGVKYLIAWAKQRAIGPNRAHHAGAIKAQDAWRLTRVIALAHLGIHRVHRHRVDFHQHVAPGWRSGGRDVQINQRIRLINRQAFPVSNGFHGNPRSLFFSTDAQQCRAFFA